jgi:hypothetical protein
MGVYDTQPVEMGYQYIVPTENGSRSDCDWISFRRAGGEGICVASTDGCTFSCSALLHSASELEQATHTCDLETRTNGKHPLHVSVDHQIMGVGGDTSWYPVVYDQFLVKPTNEFTYTIVLIPLRKVEDNPAVLSRTVETLVAS